MNLLEGLDKRTVFLCSGVYLLTTTSIALLYFNASVPEERNDNKQVMQERKST